MNPSNLAGCHVLIVEDEPLIALEIATACARVGAAVRIASSLKQALHLIEQSAPAVAILDHALGDFESTELYARLTEQRVPFVIYSGAYGIGAHPGMVVEKPARSDVLIAAVEVVLASQAETTTRDVNRFN